MEHLFFKAGCRSLVFCGGIRVVEYAFFASTSGTYVTASITSDASGKLVLPESKSFVGSHSLKTSNLVKASGVDNLALLAEKLVVCNVLFALAVDAALGQHIGSDDYLFGKWKEFSTKKSETFEWGSVDIDLNIDEENGIIKDINIASDSLEPASINAAMELLKGANIKETPSYPSDNKIISDIIEMIY